jgi:phytoene synthase
MLRLAWWRDALTALDNGLAPAEPMLRAVSRILILQGIPGKSVARIAEGWLAFVEDESASEAALDEYAAERGATMFSIAGRLCGVDDDRLALAGEGWALADRAGHAPDAALATRLAAAARARFDRLGPSRWPRRLRVLGTLVVLARRDLGRRGPGSRGARLLRALGHRITGW